jgi:hypothetical protein
MKPIDELTDAEAVYSLYWALEGTQPEIDVEDEQATRAVVREALAGVFEGRDPDALLAELTAGDRAAGTTARRCLEALQEMKDLPPSLSKAIDDTLADPPTPEKLALDGGLSLIALSALAMALMGSLKLDVKVKEKPNEKQFDLRVHFKGSEKVRKILETVAGRLGV